MVQPPQYSKERQRVVTVPAMPAHHFMYLRNEHLVANPATAWPPGHYYTSLGNGSAANEALGWTISTFLQRLEDAAARAW